MSGIGKPKAAPGITAVLVSLLVLSMLITFVGRSVPELGRSGRRSER
jgi:hypothetical protein